MSENAQPLQLILSSWIQSAPKMLLNIGVGPSRNREAEVFGQLWPEIEIVGLEPNVGLFLDRQNNYPGKLWPWGVWSTMCIKKLAVTPKDGRSSLLPACRQWRKQTRLRFQDDFVTCITLDQLDGILQHPDDIFLWMDIEGSELEALKGGTFLLESGRVGWIVLEVQRQLRRVGEPSATDLRDYIQNFGYSPKTQYKSYTIDGHLITANDVLYVRRGRKP